MPKLKLNTISVGLGLLFIVALWLADINILTQSIDGVFARTHLIPSITFPAILLSSLSYLFMVLICLIFYNEIKTKKEINKIFARLFVFSLTLGLFILLIGALTIIIKGHDSLLFGYSGLGLYHSALPLLILSVIGYVMLE